MTLYLKYRPKDFDSLVGQDFIKETLSQAISKDKLVGAYLFCGPRGTGKTSTARIFAKSINCLNSTNGKPCLKCEICRGFDDDNLVDIIEIDAASYTGVDNIREIIEKAKFSPTKCKYKIYIIDEVHMLSKGAFNALLKILEEPPEHLKFILATTEVHKVPETILSRCQRYDFKSISNQDLSKRLEFIAKNENVTIDQDSLNFILKQANGGARNAISLFEQLIFNSEIKYENVLQSYGIPKTEVISNFYNNLLNKNSLIINDFEEICANYNLNLFFKELLFFIKDETIKNLSDDNLTKQNIFLLETLENSFLSSKNSFDAKTTYLIGVIKCIKNFKNIQIEEQSIQPKPIPKETKITQPIQPKTPQTPEINHNDLLDIFGESDDFISQIPNETQKNNSQTNSFDKEDFIKKLKDIQAKGGLTMSLRASDIFVKENKIIIKSKTKISQKQILDTENFTKITQVLGQIGFENYEVVVE